MMDLLNQSPSWTQTIENVKPSDPPKPVETPKEEEKELPLPFAASSRGKVKPHGDKYIQAIQTWQNEPTPANAGVMLQTLRPFMDAAITAHVGVPNPLIRGQAKKLLVESMRTFDPGVSSPRTHIYNQLIGLKRIARNQNNVLRIPERISLEQGALVRFQKEFEIEHGREPSDSEISDELGLSAARLKQIRKFHVGLAEGQFRTNSEGEDGSSSPGIKSDSHQKMWLKTVYSDLDPKDQQIMDYTLGMNGRKRLSNEQIAQKLNMTPGAVSQRKAKIQNILNNEDELRLL